MVGEAPGAAVRFVGVRKTFGEVVAVDDVELDVGAGEFFSMLGPSGSGKTTMLRLVAGFETPTAGAILLHGTDVTSLPPFDRDVNTVFQDYALFPHMTVEQNVAYGLMVRRVPKADRGRRVAEALDDAFEAHGDGPGPDLGHGRGRRVGHGRGHRVSRRFEMFGRDRQAGPRYWVGVGRSGGRTVAALCRSNPGVSSRIPRRCGRCVDRLPPCSGGR